MITGRELADLIGYILVSHEEKPLEPGKAVRKWDGRTPFGTHPTWCAMTILTEAGLPEEFRVAGAQALLLHDILEDTTAGLPEGTSAQVAELVEGMTFAGSEEEMRLVWSRGPEIRLLKLYDKANNHLNIFGMPQEKLKRYAAYILALCDDVEPRYGTLNIVRIARAIATER